MNKTMDFTLTVYRQLLLALQASNYAFYTFEDWCDGRAKDRCVILRHDVDLKAGHSLATARIEAALGIRASYYFRIVPQSNQPNLIRAIADLGHEIGYHYEDLSLFKGDVDQAIVHFQQQLDYFRTFYPVRTICMHGSPTSRYDNRDIWKSHDYRDYGIVGEPYFDFLSTQLSSGELPLYLTDTARMWDGDKYNVRDKTVNSQQPSVDGFSSGGVKKVVPGIHSTNDFIDWLETKPSQEVMMITTHPQRWTDDGVEWLVEWVVQRLKNVVKRWLFVS